MLTLLLLSCTPTESLDCGKGTHEEGGSCVADGYDDTAAVDTGTDSNQGDTAAGETGTDTDSGNDTDSDSAGETGDTGHDTGISEACTVAADGSGEFDEIQDAIDAASDGDTIFVCPGSYEAIYLDKVDVTIISTEGSSMTFIEGRSDCAVTVSGRTTEVQGFTLSGSGPGTLYRAAAVQLDEANATFADIVIPDLSTGDSDLINSAASISTWDGLVVSGADSNSAIWMVYDGGSTTVRHAVFRGNVTPGIFSIASTDFEISNSIFDDNTNSGYGHTSVLYTAGGASGRIYNNVFYGGEGTALSLQGGTINAENNVAARYGDKGFEGFGATLDYNSSYDNGGPDVGASGTHNVSGDPKFTDEDAGDFSLQAGFSPLIDAGNPLAGYNDVDGSPNDIGAYGGAGGGW